ncbi:MAG: hypothetical protein AB1479_04675 [Pseudomonadota bacterium]
MWGGDGVVPYVQGKTGEHAIVAYTQGFLSGSLMCAQKGVEEYLLNSSAHPGERQSIHRYGVGALLSPKGLNIELWNGDGTAFTWNQTNNRCAVAVPSGRQAGMCLSPSPDDNGFITGLPGFEIKKGAYYWVRLTLSGYPGGAVGWVRLYAEFLEQADGGSVVLQTGMLKFELNKYFPDPGLIEATIGRTGAEFPEASYVPDDVFFWAFDAGF